MAGNLTRRDLLKAGVIITAVAGCGDDESRSQTPPAGQPAPTAGNLTADVVVVGAGYAGLGAAWELFKHGQKVIVLEANSRVGGRVWSSQLSDGTLFEIGGQWVADSEAQPDIRQLMQELGVGNRVYEQNEQGDNIFVSSNGTVSRYNPNDPDPLQALPPLSDLAKAELAATLFALNTMASVVHLNSPWDDVPFPAIPGLLGPQTTRQADQWSIESWMEINLSDDPEAQDAKTLLWNAFGGVFGVDTGGVSLLQLRIHWASVDSATFPYASFSGAVQSGKRAAAEVLAAG